MNAGQDGAGIVGGSRKLYLGDRLAQGLWLKRQREPVRDGRHGRKIGRIHARHGRLVTGTLNVQLSSARRYVQLDAIVGERTYEVRKQTGRHGYGAVFFDLRSDPARSSDHQVRSDEFQASLVRLDL